MNNQIITVTGMYDWCEENIKNINFIFVPEEEISNHIEKYKLEERYEGSNKVEGSRSHHSYIPISENLKMRRISTDNTFTVTNYSKDVLQNITINTYKPGMYVACLYDQDWYIGNVLEVSFEFNDIYIKFMKKHENQFSWPKSDDTCWVPIEHIFFEVMTLNAQSKRGRSYCLSQVEYNNIKIMFAQFIQK